MLFEDFVSESPEVRARMQKQTDKIRKDFARSKVGVGLAAAAQVMNRRAPTALFTAAEPVADGTLDAAKKRGLHKEGLTYEQFTEEKLLNKLANDLQHASLGGKKAQKNPFRNPSLDKQVAARKAAAQDVSKAGKFQDTSKVLKNMNKNIEPVGASSKVPGQANFGKFIATAPGTNAMRGRV